MPGLLASLLPLAFCLLAALAMDAGFGATFIQDPVAYAGAAYTAGLTAAFFGVRAGVSHWTQRRALRAFIAAAASGLWVYLLRGPLLFPLPFSDYQKSGFSPYCVLLVAGLVPLAAFELVYRKVGQRPPPAQAPSH